MSEKWLTTKVVENRHWTETLFSLRVEGATLEFYGVIVPEGPLSPRLAKLRAGDSLYVAGNPAGFLVLREVPAAETLWLISTGTGLAPFLSILRTETPWQRFKNIVVVHAVRHATELTYRGLIQGTKARYVSFVSR